MKLMKESNQMLIVMLALGLSLLFGRYTGNPSDVEKMGFLISAIIAFSVALIIQAIDRNFKQLNDQIIKNQDNNQIEEDK
jgi:hypothetical protein